LTIEGPPQARPIQKGLRQGREKENPQEPLTGIDNRRDKGKRTLSTFPQTSLIPTAHDVSSRANRVPNPLDGESDEFLSTDSEGYVETEVEWFDEPHVVDVSSKPKRNSSKMSEAVAIERPCWVNPIGSAGATIAGTSTGTTLENTDVASVGGDRGRPIGTNIDTAGFVWPSETELIYIPGTTKVMLTLQLPLIRTVLQDAFENLRSSLLIEHAFPDPNLTILFIRKHLVGAARSHLPRAVNVHRRLLVDNAYLEKLCRLPRTRMPLFRAEVKERCAGIIKSSFATTPPTTIAETVETQLSGYYYTFPIINNAHGVQLPPMRTRPYRNTRIITVIRDLYFAGGTQSFCNRFVRLFPKYEDDHGVEVYEAPIPMVALVATGLYAALYEWRSGFHQSMDFSANAFLDVYQGHVDTLQHIQDHRASSFHIMMRDIFDRAQATDGDVQVPIINIPVADINLDEMED